jgi:hypothetical protein
LRDFMLQTAIFTRILFFSIMRPLPYKSELSAKEIMLPFLTNTSLHDAALVAQAAVRSVACPAKLKSSHPIKMASATPVLRKIVIGISP